MAGPINSAELAKNTRNRAMASQNVIVQCERCNNLVPEGEQHLCVTINAPEGERNQFDMDHSHVPEQPPEAMNGEAMVGEARKRAPTALRCPGCPDLAPFKTTKQRNIHYLNWHEGVKLHQSGWRFFCTHCTERFDNRRAQGKHIAKCSLPAKYICQICTRKIPTDSALESHRRRCFPSILEMPPSPEYLFITEN
jgi:ribosomal protein S26